MIRSCRIDLIKPYSIVPCMDFSWIPVLCFFIVVYHGTREKIGTGLDLTILAL